MNTACLAPEVTLMCSAAHAMPFSSRSLRAIASRAAGVPGVATYFVIPPSSAAIAARLM